jgi:hypothetical protein
VLLISSDPDAVAKHSSDDRGAVGFVLKTDLVGADLASTSSPERNLSAQRRPLARVAAHDQFAVEHDPVGESR